MGNLPQLYAYMMVPLRYLLLACILVHPSAASTPSPEVSVQRWPEFYRSVLTRAARALSQIVPSEILADIAPSLVDEGIINHDPPSPGSPEHLLHSALRSAELSRQSSWRSTDQADFFKVIPALQGRVSPSNSSTPEWESRCWKTNKMTLQTHGDEIMVKVAVSGNKGGLVPLACADYYLIATGSAWHIGYFPTPIPGTKSFKFPLSKLSESEKWDLETNGVRAFMFRDDLHTLTASLAKTVGMFAPREMTKKCCNPPSEKTTNANLDFLKRYVNYSMPQRRTQKVMINESLIQSGDFLGIIRMDGLDPMLAWGMGSSTGHTTIAMRDENGELFVHESQVTSSYWPTNGIQKTPFKEWFALAETAGYQLTWAPLNAAARKKFNAKAALEFFREQEHLDYGFGTLLAGWVDPPEQNFPCLPPYPADQSNGVCLTWEIVQLLFPLAVKIGGPSVSQVFLESWNHRVGVQATGPDCEGCLDTLGVLQLAAKQGKELSHLWSIPEHDSWKYSQQYNNGTKTLGKAMVCNVFVCNMWKAGGLFDDVPGGRDAINCGETQNWDVYTLEFIKSDTERPAACAQADPQNPLRQLLGKNAMFLNDYGTKAPYPHLAE